MEKQADASENRTTQLTDVMFAFPLHNRVQGPYSPRNSWNFSSEPILAANSSCISEGMKSGVLPLLPFWNTCKVSQLLSKYYL